MAFPPHPTPPTLISLSLFCILLSLFTATTSTAAETLTPYEALEGYNFPVGILPKGALGYELDSSTGKFKAYLNGSCSFALEGSYELNYKSTITGTISKNKLKDLTGVSVKVFFLWLNIVEVSRSGDELYFSVGIASATFPIENFLECPQCGCGLDCNGLIKDGKRGSGRKMKAESSRKVVSSM